MIRNNGKSLIVPIASWEMLAGEMKKGILNPRTFTPNIKVKT